MQGDKYKTPFCVFCFSCEDLSVDHIIPKSLGGGSQAKNKQTLCVKCNSHKGNYMTLQWHIDVRTLPLRDLREKYKGQVKRVKHISKWKSAQLVFGPGGMVYDEAPIKSKTREVHQKVQDFTPKKLKKRTSFGPGEMAQDLRPKKLVKWSEHQGVHGTVRKVQDSAPKKLKKKKNLKKDPWKKQVRALEREVLGRCVSGTWNKRMAALGLFSECNNCGSTEDIRKALIISRPDGGIRCLENMKGICADCHERELEQLREMRRIYSS